jgi:trehalose 6-phosphate phosphatase
MTPLRRAAGNGAPRHLFDAWPDVVRRCQSAKHWLLLLDFDGTLAPLTSDPLAARPPREVRQLLGRLVRQPRARVYVISGRPLAYLRSRLKVPGLHLMGLHGWERAGTAIPERERRRVAQAKRWLRQQLRDAPGIKLEDKGLALALHYRDATPREVKLAREATLQVLRSSQHALRLVQGKNIWELLPSFIRGKGAASAQLVARFSRRWLPIYAGDDESDESAFAILRRGVTIHVGENEETKARFWLRDPAEVKEFLSRLEAMTPSKS